MKRSLTLSTYFLVAACCVLVSACSQGPVMEGPASPLPVKGPDSTNSPLTSPLKEDSISPIAPNDPRQVRLSADLAAKSIYFDYDDFRIKSEYENVLLSVVELVKPFPKLELMLVGNADERGSGEYNLALGQKRAQAVKDSLKVLGVSDAEMEAISYGKEKPRATCHEESCWAENRRVDFATPAGGGEPPSR